MSHFLVDGCQATLHDDREADHEAHGVKHCSIYVAGGLREDIAMECDHIWGGEINREEIGL